MIQFLTGGTVMGCAVAVLFFFRFWRRTRDPLFASFALAFALMGLNWQLLALTAPTYEFRPLLYLLRLAATLVILGAIIHKNASKASQPSGAS